MFRKDLLSFYVRFFALLKIANAPEHRKATHDDIERPKESTKYKIKEMDEMTATCVGGVNFIIHQ